MKHTKGKWTIVRTSNFNDPKTFYVQGGAESICQVTNEANARLIAAAPCMYEALKQTLAILQSDSFDKLDEAGAVLCTITNQIEG